MSDQHVISILVQIRDHATKALNALANGLGRFRRSADDANRDGKSFADTLRDIAGAGNNADASLRNLALSLRGLGLVLAIKYAQGLISAMIALAGAIASVASSAVFAAGAIGGAMVAGMSQAIPVVGLLVMAFTRLGAVFEAVKAQNDMQARSSQDAAAASDQQRAASDRLKTAQQQLADSQRQVQLAQERLNEARRQARRDVEDLMLAERRAELQARSANMAVAEARDAYQRVQASGTSQQVAEARMRLDEAMASRNEARVDVQRAREDNARAQRVGPAGMPQVVAAQRALAEAQRNVIQSSAGVVDAQRNIARTADQASASQMALARALEALSPAERRLYRAILRLKDTYEEVFSGPGGVLEPLINSFTNGVNMLENLMRNSKLIAVARNLANELSKALDRITGAFGSRRNVNWMATMMDEAAKNLPNLTRGLIGVARVFQNIAEAASPFLGRLLERFAVWIEKVDDAQRKGDGLEKFFKRGEAAFNAWWRLLGAAIDLLAAFIGVAEKDGTKAVNSMAKSLERAADWVRENSREVKGFLRDSLQATSRILDVVGALGAELVRVFNGRVVGELADTLIYIVIPALGNVIQIMGTLTSTFHMLLNLPIVSEMAQWAMSFFLLVKAFQMIRTAVMGALTIMTRFVVANPVLAAIMAIVAAIAVLDRKFHFLEPTFEWLKKQGQAIWKSIEPFIKRIGDIFMDVFDWVKRNWSGLLIVLTGPIGAAIVVIVKNFDTIRDAIKDVIGYVRDVFGGGGGGAFGRIIRAAATPVRMLWNAIKLGARIVYEVFKGIVETITNIVNGDFSAALDSFLGIFRGVFSAVKDFLGNQIDAIGGLFKDIVGAIGDAFHGMGGIVKGAFSGVLGFVETVINGVIDGINFMINAINSIPDIDTPFGKIGIPHIEPIGKLVIVHPEGPSSARNLSGEERRRRTSGNMGFAEGGFVPGPAGAGDVVPALLSPNEFVVTDHGQALLAALLGPGIMDWLASNQKRHTGVRKLATGGPVSGTARRRGGYRAGGRDDASMTQLTFDQDTLESWEKTWERLARLTEESVERIDTATERMKRRTAEDFERTMENLRELTRSFERNLNHMARDINTSVDEMTSVIHSGMSYIVRATNKALEAFGVDPLEFHLDRPGGKKAKRKARGGWIGNEGERGKDMVLTWLGRGEYVLNWQKQAYLRSRGVSMAELDRIDGEHAGGGIPGFARGGQIVPVPGFPGEYAAASILDEIAAVKRRFPGLILTDAYGPGHQSPGHTVYGTAADFSGPDAQMDAAVRWLVSKGYLVGYDGRFGSQAWSGHGPSYVTPNFHFHVEFGSSNATLRGGPLVEDVERRKVRGTEGPIKEMLQSAINKATKAANDFIADKTATAFNMPGHKYPGGVMSEAEVRAVFMKALKLVGIDKGRGPWVRMLLRQAWRESTFNPNAINNWDINAQNGTPSKGLLQTIEPTFNTYKLPGMNNIFNPLHNAVAAIRYMIARYGGGDADRALAVMIARGGGGYNRGGAVLGHGYGDTVPAMLTPGEHVWTKEEVEAAGGHRVIRAMRRMFGGGGQGGGGRYQTGGEVTGRGRRVGRNVGEAAEKLAELAALPWDRLDRALARFDPSLSRDVDSDADSIIDRWNRLVKSVRNAKEATRKWSNQVLGIFDDKGIWSEIMASLDRVQQRRAARQADRRFDISERGVASGRNRPRRDIAEDMAALREDARFLFREQDLLSELIDDARKKLRQARREGNEQQRRNARNTLDRLLAANDELRIALGENAAEQVSLQEQRTQDMIDRISRRTERRQARLDHRESLQGVRGATLEQQLDLSRDRVDASRDERRRLQRALTRAERIGDRETARELRAQIKQIDRDIELEKAGELALRVEDTNFQFGRQLTTLERQGAIANLFGTNFGATAANLEARGSALQAQRQALVGLLEQANQQGNIKVARELSDQIEQLDVTIAENSKAIADNTQAQYEAGLAGLDRAMRRANVFGENFSATASILQQRGGAMAGRRGQLEADLAAAVAAGDTGRADALRAQIEELDISIAENVKAIQDNTNAQYDSQLGGLDRAMRLANVFQTNFRATEDILNKRMDVLNQQLAANQGFLQQAMASGDPAWVATVSAKIEELNIALAENTKAIEDNIRAERQYAIDRITGRSSFVTGIFGGLSGILESIAQITGVQNIGGKIELTQRAGDALAQAGQGLREQLFNWLGVDLRGLSGSSFVDAVRGLNTDAIEASLLRDEDRAQFQSLINAIIENEAAIQQNTVQLKDLQGELGTVTQSFTSEAWRRFRQAIFDGSGGVLPEYDIPAMASGGRVVREGIAYLHSAEVVLNSDQQKQMFEPGDVHVNIDHPVEVADPLYLGKRIAWELSSRGRR